MPKQTKTTRVAKIAKSKKPAPAKPVKAAKPEPAGKVATGPSKSRFKYADTQRIVVKKEFRDKNPKMPHSAQHKFWAFYVGDPTVGKFRELMGDVKAANYRLRWDVERGFIDIE